MTAIIETRGVTKRFKGRNGAVLTAVNDLTCSIEPGETVGLIGESGSGKSTLGKLMLGLLAADAGEVRFEGRSISSLSAGEVRKLRAKMQVVFQEPYASLNPRLKVKSIIAEPLTVQGVAVEERNRLVAEVMARVELAPEFADRYPIQLSGGQQQRVGIARAVVGKPRFVVLDEPTASLDRTIRRNIAELLLSLQRDLGLSYLLITHDIGSVRRMAGHSLVMFRGHLVESGPTADIVTRPRHPYTKALVTSELAPKFGAKQDRYLLKPRLPGSTLPTSGCPLADVCPLVVPECSTRLPPLEEVAASHYSACLRWRELSDPRAAVTAGPSKRRQDASVDGEGVSE